MSFEIGNDTPQFKGERTFRCLLLANPEPGSNDTILRKDDAWEQLAKTGYDIDKNRKEIIPLGGIDIGMVDLRLEIQEKSRRWMRRIYSSYRLYIYIYIDTLRNIHVHTDA